MGKIGLLGGLSWVSTLEYYRRINVLTQARLGGVSSARIALESVNRQQYVDAVIGRGDEAAAGKMIRLAADSLERAGADFIVICCNDVHRFVPGIAAAIGIPFLHIAEVTARAIVEQGIQRVGLLGVAKTMEDGFYHEVLADHGLQTLTPGADDRSYVHERIYDELVHDRFNEATRTGFLAVIERLTAAGAQGVILGCTEIPLLLPEGVTDTPLFDTTRLHCEAAVDRALEIGSARG